MKSYHQYCSVARALDVAGDRWVLLIVRELLALGPSRYTDLRRGLPGIATNLLAERLKAMEAEGLVERHDAPPPVSATLFRLTDRGRELRGVLHALTAWGMEGMTPGPDAQDAVQPHWSALAGALLLRGGPDPGTEVVVGIASEGEMLHVVLRRDADGNAFEIRRGAAPAADVTLTGTSMLVGAVLTGVLSPAEAVGQGLRIDDPGQVLPGLVGAPAEPSA